MATDTEKIAILQNSVLAWLASGLGSAIGIIELSSSGLKNKRIIFEILVLVIIFSIERILEKMNDIYEIRELDADLNFPSQDRASAKFMDFIIKQLNKDFTGRIIIYILLFVIAQFFWSSTYSMNAIM